MKKLLLAILLSALPILAQAAVTEWEIDPKNSEISFMASQNNGAVRGHFAKFDGTISFDPEKLAESKAHIVVDMASVTVPYSDVAVTLRTEDWFSSHIYPKAIFDAKKFTKIDDKNFTAEGNLTIRDKTVPTTLQFTFDEFKAEESAKMKGTATVKRTAFGIGQGEWSNTSSIKDDVVIDVIVHATPKK